MTEKITLTPTTVEPGGNVRYDGAGFTYRRKVQVAIDGAGWSSNEFRPAKDGSFHASFNASSAEGIQTISARYTNAPGTIVASAPLTVKKPVVQPPTDPAPTITAGPTVTAITQTGATIGWSLSEPSTGQVEYGPTAAYGSLSTLETNLLTAHSQVLSGLTVDTTYHLRVRSRDSAGQEVVSADVSFKTTAAVVTPPIPGPEPGTRPWAAPVTSRTVDVPSTIKADGSVNVATELNAFLGTVPDGSIIRWNPNATYRLDKGMLHAGRRTTSSTPATRGSWPTAPATTRPLARSCSEGRTTSRSTLPGGGPLHVG